MNQEAESRVIREASEIVDTHWYSVEDIKADLEKRSFEVPLHIWS